LNLIATPKAGKQKWIEPTGLYPVRAGKASRLA